MEPTSKDIYMSRVMLCGTLALALFGPGCLIEVPETRDRCDAYLYVDECEAAGLPHDVGVRWGCKRMHIPWGTQEPRLKACVSHGDYKCCSTH